MKEKFSEPLHYLLVKAGYFALTSNKAGGIGDIDFPINAIKLALSGTICKIR